MMGHSTPLLDVDAVPVDCLLAQQLHNSANSGFVKDCGRDSRLQNGNRESLLYDPVSEKDTKPVILNGILEVASLRQDGDDHARYQDRAALPLSDFLSLAENQVPTQRMAKRLKTCTSESEICNVDSTIKQVADIVLVLAGLGLVRAGRAPTDVEKELQAQAYGRLGFLVQELVPGDLVSMGSIENLVKDLGLRTSEKEKTEAGVPSVVESSPSLETDQAQELTGGTAVSVPENGKDVGGISHEVLTQPLAYSEARLLQAASSLAHSPTLSLPGQEQSILTASGSNLAMMIPALKDETHLSQADLSKLLPQEVHSHFEDQVSASSSVSTLGQENMSSGVMQRQTDVSGGWTHKQLIRVIQEVIQTRSSAESSSSAAHPKPFMSVPVPCELCKLVASDTGSVLICDSCEKVYHLRCLQPYLPKGIPKSDWYCPQCAVETRHQIPKYGRVREGFSFPARPVGPAQGQPQTDLSQRTLVSGNMVAESLSIDDAKRQIGRKPMMILGPISDHHEADKSSAVLAMDGSSRHYDAQSAGGSFTALLDSFTQGEGQQQSSTLKIAQPLVQVPAQIPSHSQIQTGDRLAYFNSQLGQQHSMHLQHLPQSQFPGLKISGHEGKVAGKDTVLHTELSSQQAGKTSAELLGPKISSFSEQSKAAQPPEQFAGNLKGLEQEDPYRFEKGTDHFGVEWVGDIAQRYDGKNFYTACSVGGFLYKLHDCALFRPETPGVPPYIARLQALWEDTATGSKWVRVNWCYYPTDIPIIAGRPLNIEANEVYESNHCDNNLVGSIQGPCLVLRPESYRKEMERRQELLKGGHPSEGLVRIFLSRWLYDAPRATFRPATESASMM